MQIDREPLARALPPADDIDSAMGSASRAERTIRTMCDEATSSRSACRCHRSILAERVFGVDEERSAKHDDVDDNDD